MPQKCFDTTIGRRERRARRLRDRSGAVTVETAITLPVLFLLVFTAVEFARANSIMHTAEHAAYVGCRECIVPGATAEDARQAALATLGTVGIGGATVNVSPGAITNQTKRITVTVDVQMNSNSWLSPFFFRDRSFSGECTLRREQYSRTTTTE